MAATRDIVLNGGGPWGFTLSGGKDFGAPLKVSKITVGGKAAKGGIRFGDYIIEINGDTTEGLLHSDAMMLIKTAGTTLSLKVTKETPRGGELPAVFDAVDRGGDERPHPPPVPSAPATHTTSVAVAPKTTVVAPKRPPSPDVKAQPSRIAPESGLDAGGSSTQQSPAFKRITIESRPTIIKPAANPVTPPTQQMQNVTIDDGNVRKTSQRPQPPSNAPSTVTKTTMVVPKKEGPIAKPPPPSTATGGGTTKVGGAGGEPGGQKLSDRQGVCEACHEPIRGPFASAMNKVWHPEHFVCSGCNKSMQNTTFVFEEEKIFCEDCYQKNFAQVCHGCRKPILGPCISAVGLHWHQEHFTCSRCQADLSKGSGFNMENNILFCADCFGSVYGATCFGCGRKIGGDELWVEALEHTWHPACFNCDACRCPLEGKSFFNRLGKPVCKDCV